MATLLGTTRCFSNRFADSDLELFWLIPGSERRTRAQRRCNSGGRTAQQFMFRQRFNSSNLELCLEMDNNSVTIKLDESNFDREVNQNDKPVIVDFWAEWCGPCKMIAPMLDEIAKENAAKLKVAKVNVDENQSLSFKSNIRAIPSLLFFKNGQLRDQVTGMTSKKDLLGRIEALS